MKGVVLAAGKGSRLYPVTHITPKPLLPMANRTTLFYVFDRLKEMGISEICLVVGENEPHMKAALGDGSDLGIQLHYVRQTEPKGLAHAVGFAKEFVAGDDFCLYLGDAVYDSNLSSFAEQFKSSGAANLNLVKAVEDPRRYGVANTVGDRIVKLVEKPQNPESNLAMAGVYFFGPQLWDILPTLPPSARGEYEITDAIQALIDKGEVVVAGLYDGAWFDTGTLDSYLETTQFLIKNENLIAESAKITGTVGEKVVVGDGAVVECDSIADSVILPGAHVKVTGAIRHALLGGTVEFNGSVENTILHGSYKG
jgi:glucose-1-phosphate thymidylyltransferase